MISNTRRISCQCLGRIFVRRSRREDFDGAYQKRVFYLCFRRNSFLSKIPNFDIDMDHVPQSPRPVPRSSKRLTLQHLDTVSSSFMQRIAQDARPPADWSTWPSLMSCMATPRQKGGLHRQLLVSFTAGSERTIIRN
jgi:hypothetical protein